MGRGPLIKRIRRSALAAVCLLAVAASPAAALYYPSGPQAFGDKSQLDGWQLCFSDLYGDDLVTSLDTVLAQCNKDLLLLAGGPTGSSSLTVLAAAPRADVIFDTGQSDDPHNANGSGWYFNTDFSWGFAKEGDPISRDSCDVAADQDPGPNPDLRLCWHTGSGFLEGGYRAGAVSNLNNSTDYTRYVYHASTPSNAFSASVKGRTLLVSVTSPGTVSIADAAAPLSATASKKKKKKRSVRLKPSSASGDPPTISVPLRLTKLAKQKLRQKGKVSVKARITFTPRVTPRGGIANTQTAKLKIKGKRKK
jgi:hypothetical protein